MGTPTENKALLGRLKADWKIAEDWWADNLKLALDDIKFRVPGGQWDAKIKKAREDAGLPCVESDKINQYIRQVVNDGRQNRPAIKVSPEEGGDTEVAEAYAGLIRSICDRSNADEAFDTALDHAAGSGFGFFRVLTQPIREKSFLQELVVRRVGNPLAIRLGPHFLADGSDAPFGFVVDTIPKAKYLKLYPKAKTTNFSDVAYTDGGWIQGEDVRVVEYYYKAETTVTMHLLETGEEVADEDYQKAIAEGIVPPAIAVDADGKAMTRDFTVESVKWCRASGADILEEKAWVGKYIPIIPVYGNELNVEGKIILSGLVRPAKDPQRLYNFSRSAFAQRVAMTPKVPWTAAAEAVAGHDEWETANTGQHSILQYNHKDSAGEPIPPPQRVNPTDVPAGFQADMELAEHDIQASMGMYSASIGERSNEKSGKAIMARQREGDTATFHYQDNLNRAIRYLGRILVDAIPKVMDSRRAGRVLGEDGAAKIVEFDPEQQAPVQKIKTRGSKQGPKVIYNLNAGTYDISISAGPSYTTKRQESAEAMIELTRANPTMWQTHGDLIVKSQDWPNADEFAKRSKMTLPPELREDEDEENPEAAAAEAKVKQIMEEAQAAIAEREEALAQAEQENAALKQQLANKAGEVAVKGDEAETKQYEAETERMQALAPAITPESIALIVQQTVMEIMKQPVPMAEPPPEPMPEPALMPDPNQPPDGGFFPPEGM